MDVASILRPNRVRCEAGARSKKHALEMLSEILAEIAESVTPEAVLESLVQRERLGCTGLGRAVAMPHARLPGLEESVGAFLRLDEPVAFDSADGEPVDLLFGMLVPEDVDEKQLSEIGELIEKLGDRALQTRLREAVDPMELYDLLTESLTVLHRTLRA